MIFDASNGNDVLSILLCVQIVLWFLNVVLEQINILSEMSSF